MRFSYLSCVPLCTLSNALAFNAPTAAATGVSLSSAAGIAAPPPQLTEAPMFRAELFRRGNVQTVLLGPDNTCGYYGGYYNSYWYCYASTDICVFFLATSSTATGSLGCCNADTCVFAATACVEPTDSCDSGCLLNPLTAKCSSGSYSYCGGATFPDVGIKVYNCHSTPQNFGLFETFLTEASGFPRQFSTTTTAVTGPAISTPVNSPETSSLSPSVSIQGSILKSAASSSTLASATTPSTSPSSPALASSSTSSILSGGPGGSQNSLSSSSNPSSSPPLGVILGGSLGGVALIALIAGIVFLLWRRKNSKHDIPDARHSGLSEPPGFASPTEKDAEQSQVHEVHGQGSPVKKDGVHGQAYGAPGLWQPSGQNWEGHYAPVTSGSGPVGVYQGHHENIYEVPAFEIQR